MRRLRLRRLLLLLLLWRDRALSRTLRCIRIFFVLLGRWARDNWIRNSRARSGMHDWRHRM